MTDKDRELRKNSNYLLPPQKSLITANHNNWRARLTLNPSQV